MGLNTPHTNKPGFFQKPGLFAIESFKFDREIGKFPGVLDFDNFRNRRLKNWSFR